MPPRVSRSSLSSSKPPKERKGGRNNKGQKRSLNAFSIASRQHPDRPKIRPHRLGDSEFPSHRKRTRDDDDEGSDEEEEGRKRKRRQDNDGFDDVSVDEGSDSEGNEWKMGEVDSDDDESLDSDEAFGESDEERFSEWAFRGSSSNKKGKGKGQAKKAKADLDDREITLAEDEEEDSEGSDDDSLGEDAIDLATALDQWEESEEEKEDNPKKKKKQAARDDDSDDEPSEEDGFGGDGASDFSASDDEDEDDPSKMAQLKNLISSLPNDEDVPSFGPRKVDALEFATPSEFGISRKVDIESFKPKGADPLKKRAFKMLMDDDKPSKKNDIARKLDVPLPKRQQDKLDRAAASAKTKETLQRWVDTVKENRRAEHLSFPLKHPNAGQTMGESRLLPTTTSKPANDLESTIQSILQESGLSSKNGKDDEDLLQKWEELKTNKLPLEEVQARRAELRKQRELLYREELRAKRIKKIKSKAYRRVHRKERERLIERERDALKADGADLSEDEREYNDRRRAEERMGAKHRDSKWAKGAKKSGKALWDDDARAGITDMARRNEELRRRMEGKTVRDEDDEGSDLSSEDDDDDDDSDEAGESKGLQRQLGRLKQNPFTMDQDTSSLGNMAFMQKAEAARKARNDEDVERIRRELAGEETNSDDEDDNAAKAGRRKFGPQNNLTMPFSRQQRSEFEERPDSDDDPQGNGDVQDDMDKPTDKISSGGKKEKAIGSKNTPMEHKDKEHSGTSNPYLAPARKEKKTKSMVEPVDINNPFLAEPAKEKTVPAPKAQNSEAGPQSLQKPKKKEKSKAKEVKGTPHELPEPVISAPDADGWQTVTYNDGDSGEDASDIENEGIDLDHVLRSQALTARAFAGDDQVEADFALEKKQIAEEDDDKIVDETLPGWGSWAGEGLSKRARAKNKGRNLTKVEGIKMAGKRKDAKLERVIINEKRVKKNTKFMATQLPFPFETKDQYERSLRVPKGPEWTTKQTFQDGTKPRVLIKQGIIRPMSKPLV